MLLRFLLDLYEWVHATHIFQNKWMYNVYCLLDLYEVACSMECMLHIHFEISICIDGCLLDLYEVGM